LWRDPRISYGWLAGNSRAGASSLAAQNHFRGDYDLRQYVACPIIV
jgi:hypothetical protein